MDRIKLSARLNAVLSFINGRTLADIGTDHAYLPIAACLNGRCGSAVACDIKPGPLEKAAANINAYGLSEKIHIRQGNGLEPLTAGEAENIVIAGMGGMRIAEIITAQLETARSAQRLVLQPQHDAPRLRRAAHSMGFFIEDETTVWEDGHFYLVTAVRPLKKDEKIVLWNTAEYDLGRYERNRGSADWRAFADNEIGKLTRYIEDMETNGAAEEAISRFKARLAGYKNYASMK